MASCSNKFSSILFIIIPHPHPDSLPSDLSLTQDTALCVIAQGSASCHMDMEGGSREVETESPSTQQKEGPAPEPRQSVKARRAAWVTEMASMARRPFPMSFYRTGITDSHPWMQVPSPTPPKYSRRME